MIKLNKRRLNQIISLSEKINTLARDIETETPKHYAYFLECESGDADYEKSVISLLNGAEVQLYQIIEQQLNEHYNKK